MNQKTITMLLKVKPINEAKQAENFLKVTFEKPKRKNSLNFLKVTLTRNTGKYQEKKNVVENFSPYF